MKIKCFFCCGMVVLLCGCAQKPSADVEQQLKEKAIFICEAIVKKDYQAIIDQGDLTIRYQVTPELMKQSLQIFPDTYGDFIRIGSCYSMIQQGYYFVCIDVIYENYKHVFQIVFNNNLNVTAISLK